MYVYLPLLAFHSPAYQNTHMISYFITYLCTFMNMNMQIILSNCQCVVIMPILVWFHHNSQNTASSQPKWGNTHQQYALAKWWYADACQYPILVWCYHHSQNTACSQPQWGKTHHQYALARWQYAFPVLVQEALWTAPSERIYLPSDDLWIH